MRKLTAFIIASTLAIGSSTLAYAVDDGKSTQPPAGKQMMHHKKGPHDGNMFQGLNLTPQQREQMRDIMQQLRKDSPRPDMENSRTMHQLIIAENFDEAQVKAQIDASAKAHAERTLERMRAQNKMYNLLTPEQKKEFTTRYEQRMQKMSERAQVQPAS